MLFPESRKNSPGVPVDQVRPRSFNSDRPRSSGPERWGYTYLVIISNEIFLCLDPFRQTKLTPVGISPEVRLPVEGPLEGLGSPHLLSKDSPKDSRSVSGRVNLSCFSRSLPNILNRFWCRVFIVTILVFNTKDWRLK